jgi:hypothetical protein
MAASEKSKSNLRPRARKRERSAEEEAEAAKGAKEMELSIEAMAGNGLTPQEISLLTNIRPDRLYRRYRQAMMTGGARRKNEVAESAYKMAVGGPEKNWRQADASMNKFWLERQGGAGWAPPKPDSQEGPDLSRLSVPQLIELERALRPLARNPVLIEGSSGNGTIEHDAEPRAGGGGIDEKGVGDLDDGGVGERVVGAGEVPE